MNIVSYFIAIIAAAFIYMTLWFGVSRLARRNDVADVAWGLGFGVVAWTSFILGKSSFWPAGIINILVTVWGVRLAAHIYLRSRGKQEDKRYGEMRATWGKRAALHAYVEVFLTQGLLLLLIAIPVMLANRTAYSPVHSWQVIGGIVWVVGFFFETVGDQQLST